MEDLKTYLLEKVLLSKSDTFPPDTEKVLRKIRREKADVPIVYVSYNSGSIIAGADRTYEAVLTYVRDNEPRAEVVKVGFCGPVNYEPLISVQLPGKNRLFFRNISEEKVEPLLDSVFHSDLRHDDLIGQSGAGEFGQWSGIEFIRDLPFFAGQKRIILQNCGSYDPESIEEYIAHGGYRTFVKTIMHYPYGDVCDIIERSGLRGRSGGGYLTGLKWKQSLNTPSNTRYLICNARESDPGSFSDRLILESDPHRLIEGIAIASYAICASLAIIYLKSGSSQSYRRLLKAIDRAREFGVIGHNIYSSGFSLDIMVKTEPGAFVCGEETALINSLEGRRGMPKIKPPYPTSFGLSGKPTVINNVETLMNVPLIMQNGPEWFRSIGTESSPGTKVFAVSGRGRFSGIIEVEMGTTLKSILSDIIDGVKDGKEFKAIQLGGPSGSFIASADLDTKVDFDSIKQKGFGMGAGGFVVIDESSCMVDLVRFNMEFMAKESCGKCIPCREGTGRMLQILESVIRKPVNEESGTTLERFKGVMQLETISAVMKDASLCGLGQTAPNPFISALRYFREEFEEHIFDRKCRANTCRDLRTFIIDVEKCTGCTVCAGKCPENAIYGTRLNPYFIVQDKCTGCGICHEVCKFSAVIVK
jgi:NADH:ubiquinone oxidoreductase subunit F (NADH-binding)